jgi:hypothetical protein
MTDIGTTIDIHAPRAKVWSILVDLARYPEWNPFTPRVEATLKVGDPVILHVRMKPEQKTMRQPEVMTSYVEGEELGWGTTMGHRILLHANRTQKLVDLGGDRTRYESVDRFEGAIVPLVMALYGKHVQRGFDETARALKARAEAPR